MSNGVIELSVTNSTGRAVSRAYFDAILATPGREIPWVAAPFNYSIPGGMEPGESDTWRLSLNMFGEWSDAPADRQDMVLTVEAARLDGADGQRIFPERFTDADADATRQALERAGPDGQRVAAKLATWERGRAERFATEQRRQASLDIEEAERRASQEQEEAERHARKEAEAARTKAQYIAEHVELYDMQASYMNSLLEGRVPGVLFKLKNTGDATLSTVEVTVYFRDESGARIAEEDFHPVLAGSYSLASRQPLKPGYVWQMEKGKFYTAKSVPSEWAEGNVEAKVTDIEFAETPQDTAQ
jgi:hypothetical protein